MERTLVMLLLGVGVAAGALPTAQAYDSRRSCTGRREPRGAHLAGLVQRIKRLTNRAAELRPTPTGMQPSYRPFLKGRIKAVIWDIYGTKVMSAAGYEGAEALTESAANKAATAHAFAPALAQSGLGKVLRLPAGQRRGKARAAALAELDATADTLLATTIVRQHKRVKKDKGENYQPEIDIRDMWSNVLHSLVRRGLLEKTGPITQQLLERLAVEYEFRKNPVALMPHVLETLAELQKQGIVMGIVSNAQFYTKPMFRALTGKSLAPLGIDPDLIVESYQQGEAKPTRAVFDRVMAGLARRNIQPTAAVYVGNDKLKDGWTSKQRAMNFALFAGDERSLRLKEGTRADSVDPDAVLTDLRQLLEIVR